MTSKSRDQKLVILILREIDLKFSIRPLRRGSSSLWPLKQITISSSAILNGDSTLTWLNLLHVQNVYWVLPLFQPQTPSRRSFLARLLHLHHSFACDDLNSFPVALTKKGLKHVTGTKSRQKHPITVDLLRRMKNVLDLSILTKGRSLVSLVGSLFLFSEKI